MAQWVDKDLMEWKRETLKKRIMKLKILIKP
jgi:hypothetical protein